MARRYLPVERIVEYEYSHNRQHKAHGKPDQKANPAKNTGDNPNVPTVQVFLIELIGKGFAFRYIRQGDMALGLEGKRRGKGTTA